MAAGKLVLKSAPVEYALREGGEIEVPDGVTLYRLPSTGKFIFHMRNPDSQLLIRSVVIANNSDRPELNTETVHHASATQAETIVRTLSSDIAQPRYAGKIIIMPGAKGCESYLSHHSLLLDRGSYSWSVPSLEIGNNEVKCSHAATLRTLTDNDLFYLRSRGLTTQSAKELLIDAFLAS